MSGRTRKLLRMKPRELGSRSMQLLRRRVLDRWRYRWLVRADQRDPECDLAEGIEQWVVASRRLTPALLVQDRWLPSLGRTHPELLAAWLGESEAIMQGKYALLGYAALDWGWPPAWDREPISGIDAVPNGYCWGLDPLDEAAFGDVKVVWELHRLQWLVRMALAARATGRKDLTAAVGEALDGWLDAYPPLGGVGWSSALEVALRGFSLTWLVALCGAEWLGTNRDRVMRLRGRIRESRRHVTRNRSTYFAPNTHLLGELLWLACSGWVWGSEERGWAASGREYGLLWEQTARVQTGADGIHDEQSVFYHRYAVEFALQSLLTQVACGMRTERLWASTHARLTRMLMGSEWLLGAHGEVACLGDDDGGRLWPWTRWSGGDWGWRGLFQLGAALGVQLTAPSRWIGAAAEPELVLGLGHSAAPGCEGVGQVDLEGWGGGLGVASAAGWVVMKQPATEVVPGLRVVWDCGPIGPVRTAAGHGHEDIGSFVLWRGGEPWVVDRGTGDYLAEGRRRVYRATSSHNLVDWGAAGVQARGDALFRRERWIRARLGAWYDCGDIKAAAGSWIWLDGVRHGHRGMVMLRDRLLVLDGLTAGVGDEVGRWRIQLPWSVSADWGEGVEGVELTRELGTMCLAWWGDLFEGGRTWAEPRRWSPTYGLDRDGGVLCRGVRARSSFAWGLTLMSWSGGRPAVDSCRMGTVLGLRLVWASEQLVLGWRMDAGLWAWQGGRAEDPRCVLVRKGEAVPAGWRDEAEWEADRDRLLRWLEGLESGADRGAGCVE